MKVHLLVGTHMLDVELVLSMYGIVVIETTRPHAVRICELARARLFPTGRPFPAMVTTNIPTRSTCWRSMCRQIVAGPTI